MNTALKQDILGWDVESWSIALDYWENNIDWSSIHNALEIGANKGGISLWLAKKNVKVVCSDLEHVERNAIPLHEKHQITHLISYQNIDASSIPYEAHFDCIVLKSVLGGIGRNDNFELQKKTIISIDNALRPGGYFLYAENLKGTKLHRYLRRKFISWGDSWRYLDVEEMKVLLQNFDTYTLKTTGFMATFGRNEKQRKILSIFDRYFLNYILPKKWRYISYGIAIKKK